MGHIWEGGNPWSYHSPPEAAQYNRLEMGRMLRKMHKCLFEYRNFHLWVHIAPRLASRLTNEIYPIISVMLYI